MVGVFTVAHYSVAGSMATWYCLLVESGVNAAGAGTPFVRKPGGANEETGER